MATVGYIPFKQCPVSTESLWLKQAFKCDILVLTKGPTLNISGCCQLPNYDSLQKAIQPLLALNWLIAEGPGAFLYTAILRAHGYNGGVTILPYLNPRQWYDAVCIAIYIGFTDPRDRIFLGSTPSAGIYRAMGLNAGIGEPYGIDCERFKLQSGTEAVLETLGIPRGRFLLYTGRVQPDKHICRFLRVALRARILFPDLNIVIATHVVDEKYLAEILHHLQPGLGIYIVRNPAPSQLVDIYNAAELFVTAATSHFETFGRAPAEALVCGTPVIAPRYDGFVEVLAQPGGTCVDVDIIEGVPQVNEEQLLRAIYDKISSSSAVPATKIAEIARRRFCRQHTIKLLRHTVEAAPGPAPLNGIPPADLSLPACWKKEINKITNLPPAERITSLWNSRQYEEFESYNSEFRMTIRRNLCQWAIKNKGGVTLCH